MKNNSVIYNSLLDRDKQILDFLSIVKVATREQVQLVLFKNLHKNIPTRRLKYLADNKLIKRSYYQLKEHKNAYVYYLDKKPAKRNIKHNLLVTEFIVKTMDIVEVLEVKTAKSIGVIIPDAYIKYRGVDGKTRHLVLEVQLSNKVEDCINKYKYFKNEILEHEPAFKTIPRIVVITDLPRPEKIDRKVHYDNLSMNHLREVLF